MPQINLQNGKIIENHTKPYIIAEINSSHNGNIETARKMIEEIQKAGCDCVKFQSWSTESLYAKSYYDNNPIAKRIVKGFSLSEEDLYSLMMYCHEVGLDCSSTPYSEAEVDFLVDKCKVPFIKIASMEINNHGYLRYIASKGLPVVLSTGMGEIEEIKKAVESIESAGNTQIILLHCISIYPAEPETIHLNNIPMLQELFPNYPIGFSDHTLGTEIATAATALGTAVIEKHFTLDKSKMGMDNNMAIEPKEMADLVYKCNCVYKAMGSKERVVSQAEYAQREKMRRSVITAHKLEAGTVLKLSDLAAKRPGTGIPVDQIESLVGKTLITSVDGDVLLEASNIVE